MSDEETNLIKNGESGNPSEEDISKAVETILGTPNFVILRHILNPLSERIGLLGDHSTLDITILDVDGQEKSLSLFVKFFPKLEAAANFAEGISAFKKEMFVYELFKTFEQSDIYMITNITPRCYLAKYNKYLILDNLASDDFKTLNKHETINYDVVIVVLQSLAKLHASSIIYEENKSRELGESYRLTDEYKDGFDESFFNDREDFVNVKGVEASIKCVLKEIDIFEFPDKLSSGKSFTEMAEKFCWKIYDLVKPSTRFRNVLSHGDLWATNFLLKYNSDNEAVGCKFVDFQCGRYVPPAQDILSVLFLTTSREFRKKHLYQLIGVYYTYLEKHLKIAGLNIDNILSFSDFMESCEEQKLFAIIQTAIYFPLILISNDLVGRYISDKELNEKALFEDRSYLVLAHMDKDESYRERLKDSIQDLKDYCEYR